jgi:hypothetical protein
MTENSESWEIQNFEEDNRSLISSQKNPRDEKNPNSQQTINEVLDEEDSTKI